MLRLSVLLGKFDVQQLAFPVNSRIFSVNREFTGKSAGDGFAQDCVHRHAHLEIICFSNTLIYIIIRPQLSTGAATAARSNIANHCSF